MQVMQIFKENYKDPVLLVSTSWCALHCSIGGGGNHHTVGRCMCGHMK